MEEAGSPAGGRQVSAGRDVHQLALRVSVFIGHANHQRGNPGKDHNVVPLVLFIIRTACVTEQTRPGKERSLCAVVLKCYADCNPI